MQLIRVIVLIVLLVPGAATAGEMEDWFPRTLLEPARAEALLTADRLGPPAETFDSRTTTDDAVDPFVKAVEEAAFGAALDRVRAPDALRRYGEIMLQLYREGQPLQMHRLFVADHVGLWDVPYPSQTFMTGSNDVADVARLVKPALDAEARRGRVAVTLHRDEAEAVWVGMVWRMDERLGFESFSRVYEPGESLTIPGVQVDGKTRYSLWMTQPGTDVLEVPIEGVDGRFDLRLTMPEEPGVYRISLSVQKKRRMPDNPFFFSVYVGVQPPTAFESPIQAADDELDSSEEWEERLTSALNAVRVGYGLSPMEVMDKGAPRMRHILRETPEREQAAFRYLTRQLRADPLPEEPHGLWHPAFVGGFAPSDTLWMVMENPISRATLLAPECVSLALGVVRQSGSEVRSALFVAMEAPPDAESAADLAFASISERAAKELTSPPKLTRALTDIAEAVAAGKISFKRAQKEVGLVFKKTDYVGGSAGMYFLATPAGQEPDVSEFELPRGAKYLAIGHGVGDMGGGDGVQWAVLVLVASTKAK